jgi:hypothetical protein
MSTGPDRQRCIQAQVAERITQNAIEGRELAKADRQRNRHYGSFVAATVMIGPVAVGFVIVDLVVNGKLPALDIVGYFLASWAAVFVCAHAWMWEYFTWGRDRQSRR